MEKFTIAKDTLKPNRRFKVHARTLEFNIKPIPEDEEPVGWVKEAIEQIVKKATSHLDPSDKVGITFCSKELARGPGYLKFIDASKLTVEDMWSVINGVFQSNSTGLNTDTFCLAVTSLRLPKGKGRGKRYNTFNEECARRRGIVTIDNKDNLCLPRALVVATAHANKDPDYIKVRRDIGKLQIHRAHELIEYSRVQIPEAGAGIEELHQFQRYLSDYKIVVYRYGSKGRDMVFEGKSESDTKLHLLYHNNHYNVITSLTAAFCCDYYCEECHVPYDHKNKHRCGGTCQACQQCPACKFELKIKCSDCNRTFRGQTCFDNHKKSNSLGRGTVCGQIRMCDDCLKTIKSDRQHTCGEIYCKICEKHKPQVHLCYMTPDTGTPITKDFLFVFYDLESRQETQLESGDLLHEPNLCVFKTACAECLSSDVVSCVNCGHRLQILKINPLARFLEYILNQRRLFKKIVVMAHNGQAYDHQFILNYILTKTDLKPELIMRGTKIVQMVLDNVKFIDSLNYFPMALSALPKAFGLEDSFKKGYFPHLFNKIENQNYVGPLPATDFFSPDNMKDKARGEFLKWHEENKLSQFDFQKELVEYCISDVEILSSACLKFRELLMNVGTVCPFTEACTIASACNKVYRRNFLEPNTIGIIPKRGYRWRDNQSKIATQWLVWEEHQREINIIHSAKQNETVLDGLKVDGYCQNLNQVFEFHGCYYHGCTQCFKHDREKPLHDNPQETLNLRYESTLLKMERLRSRGYEVVEMWECAFRQLIKDSPEMSKITEDHPFVKLSPLNPRDSFYGGRTGNCKEFYEAKEDEKIKYIDICSLYPWACKYGKFPIGHPEVIVGHEECARIDLSTSCGLIKCSVLPPQTLYHPVLPQKMNNKLMFVLCRTCGEQMDQDVDCTHNDSERTLHGTWVIEEVQKALEKGYKLIEIQEIWNYRFMKYDRNTKTGGLFTEMMNKFIKYKTQASGWPGSCTTQQQKDDFSEEFFNAEGVRLEFNEILDNPGLRCLAKLILNSFWGKLGQRENQPKTAIVNQPSELFEMITNPSIDIIGILSINENVVVVSYEFLEEAYNPMSTVNVTLAAYTTAQARLKLYSHLEKLEERVLYYDTDSVIYIAREGEYDVPTGNFVGDMTDELEPKYGKGSFILKFASGGPKNYGFEVNGQKGIEASAKVKGITLNYATSKLINFNKITEMILKRSEPVPVVITNIRRTADHQLVTRTETKLYKPKSTKRRFINYDSFPYGFKRARLD